jgi:hypothetical protein
MISGSVFAQTGTVRGFVYEKKNGEPIIFTNVVLKGTSIGAATDVNGFYSITKVPAGNYTLRVTSLGYDTLEMPVVVKGGDIITKQLYVSKSSINLKTIDITGDKQEKQTEVKVSVTKVTPKEIQQIPTVGGEADIAQYLQVLPGVIFTGDQGGQLYIRGGSPVQNMVLLDGMVIYNPFHSIGLFSVFDTDIIKNADVYTGGYNAEYGGRISSVMDIKTKDGNKSRLGGKFSTSTFGAKAMLEGPLKKRNEEDPNSGSSSFILSYKNSYLDQSSKLLYSYADEAGLPFSFNDLYGKVSLNAANGSKASFFGFNFNDKVKYRNAADIQWNSYGFGSNFLMIPSSSSLLVEGHVAYSNYTIGIEEQGQAPRSSEVDGFNLGFDFTYFIKESELKYGIEVIGLKTDFQYQNTLGRTIQQEQNTTEFAIYAKYRYVLGKLVIDPGFRAHYFASLNNISPEPRLGMKYNINDDVRLKFAGGMYAQNLISANSDRDVVNLFYGFLSGSDNLPSTFMDKNGNEQNIRNSHRLQKANHLILGVEYDITNNLEINVETYLKQFTRLTEINRNKLFDDNAANIEQPDALKKNFAIETGTAKGVDVVLKYDKRQFYVWAVYSLGFVDRWDGTQLYRPIFDRRHNVNLTASYTFGKDLSWELNGRWNYGSGFPFTPTAGFYENIAFTPGQGGINGDYISTNGNININYGDLNSKRLPDFHRMDITIKKGFEFKNDTKLELNAGVTNMYNRQNIFYFDRVRYERVDQLPFLPSFGANYTF